MNWLLENALRATEENAVGMIAAMITVGVAVWALARAGWKWINQQNDKYIEGGAHTLKDWLKEYATVAILIVLLVMMIESTSWIWGPVKAGRFKMVCYFMVVMSSAWQLISWDTLQIVFKGRTPDGEEVEDVEGIVKRANRKRWRSLSAAAMCAWMALMAGQESATAGKIAREYCLNDLPSKTRELTLQSEEQAKRWRDEVRTTAMNRHVKNGVCKR